MDAIPERRPIAKPYRVVITALEKHIYLPDISPSYYHLVGLILSIAFLFASIPTIRIGIIVLILLADWLDEATARRFDRCSRSSYALDVATDRLSEGLIFSTETETTLGKVFYLLWLVNLILAFYSFRSNKHTSLPLRCAFVALLILQVSMRISF